MDERRLLRTATLDDRLLAAKVPAGATPVDAWRALREAEGASATIIDLYELAARERNLAAHELPLAERVELAQAVMPDVWPGWTLTRGSSRGGDLIRVVDYDPQWPVRFSHWREILQTALGDRAVRIEHVGSTSVPGLCAKPIVDVQLSLAELDDEPGYVEAIEAIGLQLRSRDELHRYFRPFPNAPRDVHLHVCQLGSTWELEHVRLRDLLRADPGARDAYCAAKRAAAARWADDGFAYTDAKTEIILQLLATANAS